MKEKLASLLMAAAVVVSMFITCFTAKTIVCERHCCSKAQAARSEWFTIIKPVKKRSRKSRASVAVYTIHKADRKGSTHRREKAKGGGRGSAYRKRLCAENIPGKYRSERKRLPLRRKRHRAGSRHRDHGTFSAGKFYADASTGEGR